MAIYTAGPIDRQPLSQMLSVAAALAEHSYPDGRLVADIISEVSAQIVHGTDEDIAIKIAFEVRNAERLDRAVSFLEEIDEKAAECDEGAFRTAPVLQEAADAVRDESWKVVSESAKKQLAERHSMDSAADRSEPAEDMPKVPNPAEVLTIPRFACNALWLGCDLIQEGFSEVTVSLLCALVEGGSAQQVAEHFGSNKSPIELDSALRHLIEKGEASPNEIFFLMDALDASVESHRDRPLVPGPRGTEPDDRNREPDEDSESEDENAGYRAVSDWVFLAQVLRERGYEDLAHQILETIAGGIGSVAQELGGNHEPERLQDALRNMLEAPDRHISEEREMLLLLDALEVSLKERSLAN